MEKLTKVATLALPIAVKEFDDGEYGWEIGPRGLLAWDVGCRSFDEAEGAARAAAERLEKDMLERYTDAASTITAQTPAPGSIRALLEAMTDIRTTLLKQADSRYVPTLGDLASMLDKADAALAPFKGAQEVNPDARHRPQALVDGPLVGPRHAD